MRILIDLGHPADVHYFKHLISYLGEKGDQVKVLARDKDVTIQLLHAYQIPFTNKGKGGIGFFDRIAYTLRSIRLLHKTIRDFKPDICISHASPYLALMASIYKKPHIMFNDTEGAFLFKPVSRFLNPRIYTPDTFSQKTRGNLNTFPSYMELAYLHPDIFAPDESVRTKVGDDFVFLRFVANKATHDIGHLHLDDNYKRELADRLSDYAPVWISSEDPLPEDLQRYQLNVDPSEIHDVISRAKLLVGEGATMCSEAAMLGVPAIFINQNKLGYITELDKKYGLVDHFSADKKNRSKALERAVSILENPDRQQVYAQRRNRMLRDKKNLTEMMIQIVETTASGIGTGPSKKRTNV